MKKQILAAAVAGAVAGVPAIAAADVTLFGQAKYEVGYVDDGSDHNFAHSTKGTRIGIKGSEDLGGGTKAIFQLRGNFSGVNTTFKAQDFEMNEEAWLGLTGGFGTLRLGRSNSAVKNASKPFRAFTDTLADSGVTRPEGWYRAEGIHYQTPSFGGATIGATFAPNGDETDGYFAANVIFDMGPLNLHAAAESFEDGTPGVGQNIFVDGGETDETNYQVGASYDFGMGDVGLQYQARNDGDDDVYTLPVNFSVTPNVNLRAAVQHRSPDVGDSSTSLAVGPQYNFSKRTEAYAIIWKNDVPNVGDTRVRDLADDVQFSVGMRHSF